MRKRYKITAILFKNRKLINTLYIPNIGDTVFV